MSIETEIATSTVASEWYHGTCHQCQRWVELAIVIAGIGALCPGCGNVLDEEPEGMGGEDA